MTTPATVNLLKLTSFALKSFITTLLVNVGSDLSITLLLNVSKLFDKSITCCVKVFTVSLLNDAFAAILIIFSIADILIIILYKIYFFYINYNLLNVNNIRYI